MAANCGAEIEQACAHLVDVVHVESLNLHTPVRKASEALLGLVPIKALKQTKGLVSMSDQS